jgi:hypothetical protein
MPFLTYWLPIHYKKSIGILLMNSPNPLTRKHLVTRFSIDNRPTPASSSPSLSPSSAHASPLKPYDRPSQSPSLSQYDRNIPSFSPCDRPNHSPTPASDRQTASPSQDLRQSLSPCDRPFSGSVFGPCDRPTHGPSDRPPKCKTLSMRRESAKRSACLHLSQKLKRLARPCRKTMRYRFGFLWGLWLRVAVQNIIHSAPRGCPAASALLLPPAQLQQRGQ